MKYVSAQTLLRWLARGILAGLFLFDSVLMFGYSRGYQALSVQSDSMRPMVSKGGVVIVDRRDTHVAVGDVVSYRSPLNNSVINTHRIVAIDLRRGFMTTKGDNVPTRDTSVPLHNTIGTVRSSIPLAGYLLDTARRPFGLIVLVYVPAVLLVTNEVRRLNRYYRSPPRHYVLYH